MMIIYLPQRRSVRNFTLVNVGPKALMTPIKGQCFLHDCSGLYILTAVFVKLHFFGGVTLFP